MNQIGSSLSGLRRELEVITHNLANVSTPGFKRRCNAFSQVLENNMNSSGENPAKSISVETVLDFSQGAVKQTQRSLDAALQGAGFFVIETQQGPRYTRNGMFQINHNGQIVDGLGRTIAGQSGPINIPKNISESQINITDDGSISAGGVKIDKIRLVNFPEEQDKLIPVGNSCFMYTGKNNAKPAENLKVKQGFREASNVKMVDELVDMIMVSRLYEANTRMVAAQKGASDSLMSVAMG